MDLSGSSNSELLCLNKAATAIRKRTPNICDIIRQSSADSAQHSVNSSSSEDLDDLCIDHELVDIDEVVAPRKPHFLDYDAVPPPGFEPDAQTSTSTIIDSLILQHQQQCSEINSIATATTAAGRAPHSRQTSHESRRNPHGIKQPHQMNSAAQTPTADSTVGVYQYPLFYPGESVKVDKKFEKDGEISDYELAASGYTKRDLSAMTSSVKADDGAAPTVPNPTVDMSTLPDDKPKKKHFLDENPIPPDYMLPFERDFQREHRSLDRNFERQNEYENIQHIQSDRVKYERKHSLERDCQASSARRMKEPSYTLSRFIESDLMLDQPNAVHSTWPVMDLKVTSTSKMIANEHLLQKNLGPKVECVYSLLSMLGNHDSVEMSKKFYDLSRTPETCATLRRSGCIPLLVQMMHSDADDGVRKRSAMALHNVVHCHPDDKAGRREAKVLRLIEMIMDYCAFLRTLLQSGGEAIADDSDRHPLTAISSLMKVSFDEEHRHAMCQLGALQAIASLVHLDHAAHGPKPEEQSCNSLRRYALMALTNLTFGDGNNKALLCANKDFMEALVAQLDTAPDDLLQVTASVLRNLSWRADSNMKSVLNEIGTVTELAKAAMKNKNENTLKAILSALWNLSAHCSNNKAEFCAVEGTLAFLVDMLTYEGPSKTLKIIENAGGILRNLSSHIAVREDYRRVLRQRNCLGILLQQLKSESLTVVSNACGTLWNLSARCPEDQKFLWDNGAVPMLRSLINSKHKMIAEGSSAALRNLLNFRPVVLNHNPLDPIAKSMGLKELPTLNVRKQKALESELNPNLAETCENIDVVTPPKEKKDFLDDQPATIKHSVGRLTRSTVVSKSESRDSIMSAKSDSTYEKLRRGSSAPPQSSNTNSLRSQPDYGSGSNAKSLNAFNIPRPTETSVYVDESPIDYAAKYNEDSIQNAGSSEVAQVSSQNPNLQKMQKNEANYSTYQETDLDQPTDFSLRYAENQVESDEEIGAKPSQPNAGTGNEIILILEDSVKCYQTEDTPYVISNAASITDLRAAKPEEVPIAGSKKISVQIPKENANNPATVYGSGSYTPEKPINYCEEGTPGYFSRYESLSSLEESPPQNSGAVRSTDQSVEAAKSKTKSNRASIVKDFKKSDITHTSTPPKLLKPKLTSLNMESPRNMQDLEIPESASKAINLIDSAQETPLMFSRHSSMDSLVGEETEPMIPDDKSSVVSDFSRLASGVISPSDLPDSPTQSMPQSPRCLSNAVPNQNDGPAEERDLPTFDFETKNLEFGSAKSKPQNNDEAVLIKNMKKLEIGQDSTPPKPTKPRAVPQSPKMILQSDLDGAGSVPKAQHLPNSAQETPLMFSRRSSMDSLVGEETEPMIPDDKSSVVSDFSRLASGVISPSDLPDSPTQSMPQSPRRLSNPVSFGSHRTANNESERQDVQHAEPLRSIFDDGCSAFQVENTPAQFSCATSLSNLSLDDEPKIATDSLNKEMLLMVNSPKEATHLQAEAGAFKQTDKVFANKRESINISENEDETTNDDDLLAAAISSGMNRSMSVSKPKVSKSNDPMTGVSSNEDAIRQYCTEGTPAFMSKVGSNSNLSMLSMQSNKEELVHMSDISSNASDDCMDLFQQCIREGMQKPSSSEINKKEERIKVEQSGSQASNVVQKMTAGDPIGMLRRGGLPPYLPVKDEMNKFLVEDSPCNFSVISGLSNLTVGSNKAGLANVAKLDTAASDATKQPAVTAEQLKPQHDKKHVADDSLSSISIESEDDSNLLSQAIAAGWNRPKSNLGRPKVSSSVSQPQAVPRAGSNFQPNHFEPNDSLSSVDSSDSNDNQAKSLFEQCIQSGMNKSVKNKKDRSKSSQSFNPVAMPVSPKRSQLPTLSNIQKTPLQMDRERQRERERKDEQLLKECITTGMSSKSTTAPVATQVIKQPSRHVRQVMNPIDLGQRLVTGGSGKSIIAPPAPQTRSHQSAMDVLLTAAVQQQLLTQQHQQNQQSKNGETTSVVVLEQLQNHQLDRNNISYRNATSTAPDVVAHQQQQSPNNYPLQYHEVRESPDGTSTEVRSLASTPATICTPQGIQTITPATTTAATSPIPPNRSLSPATQHISQSIQQQDRYQQHDYNNSSNVSHQKSIYIEESTTTGCNQYARLQMSHRSMTSSADTNLLEQSNEYPAFKISNLESIDDSVNNESFDMELSNEFLIDRMDDSPTSSMYEDKMPTNNVIQDKHKDPDLMLKSVERLTQELVATAEYLRNNPDCVDFDNVPISLADDKHTKSESNSNSNNNTWNENTCPNDISFPSISVSAPLIASMNEDTTISDGNNLLFACSEPKETVEKTPTNEFPPTNEFYSNSYFCADDHRVQESSQPNSIDAETYTLVGESIKGVFATPVDAKETQPGIQFIVGGEVKHQQMTFSRANHLSSSGPFSLDTSSTMTNSTIIAMEASKIANNLMRNMMTDSAQSLDLDNVRPPSCMESLSMSGCYEMSLQNGNIQQLQLPQSPQLSKLRKKSLPAGLMARRALGCNTHMRNEHSGSLESVNSSYNLDNVKPPSLMDELLDSMISVASITSEIVDNSLGTNITNYDTAFSDGDDQTATLQSCMDGLPTDSNDDSTLGTPIPSDFSSVESTPRKAPRNHQNNCGVKRMMTPKQKRKMVKDRFKTYTVAADFVLKENFHDSSYTNEELGKDDDAPDEILKIEIEDGNSVAMYDRTAPADDQTNERLSQLDRESPRRSISSADHSPADRSPSTNKKRRNLDPDRFKTRTIVYSANSVSSNDMVTKSNEHESFTSTEDDSEEMSSIRALTKQFKFITQPEMADTTLLNQKLSSIPVKNAYLRMKMLEDEGRILNGTSLANLTAESDYNSMEFDQNSETESCCDQRKPNTNPIQTTDEEDDLSPKRKSSHPNSNIMKAHIVKPGDKDSGTDLNFSEDPSTPPEATIPQSKVVRGRKKPAYVSPYKKSILSAGNSASSTRTTSPKSQIGNTIVRANLASKNPDIKKNVTVAKHNPKPTTIVAKTHILLNKANLTNKINAIKTGLTKPGFTSNVSKKTVSDKNILNKKLNFSKPSKSAPKEPTAVPLERQGTFVKDEPSIDSVPIVGSLPTSPNRTKIFTSRKASGTTAGIAKPSNIPKSPLRVATTATSTTIKTRAPIQKSSSTTSANILGSSKLTKTGVTVVSTSRLSATVTTTTTVSRDTQIAQLRKSSLIGVRKCPSVPTVPQRSNSNASLRPAPSVSGLRTDIPVTQPPSRSNSNLTSGSNKISQIGSRIAGIWKRVEECKKANSQSKQNNNTKASCPQDGQNKAQNIASGGKPPTTPSTQQSQSQPSKLIRSSTFDNSPYDGAGPATNKKFVATKISHKI